MDNSTATLPLLSALYRISEMTTTVSDLSELYATIHRIVGELMYATNFYIARYEPASNTLSFAYSADDKDVVRRPRPLGRGMTEYVLRTERPIRATREVIEGLIESGEYIPSGNPCFSWMGVPLKTERTFGVMSVQSYDPSKSYSDDDLQVLTFVGQQVARVIEHKCHEEALRASELRYRSLFERNKAGVFRSSLDGHILDCNQAFATMFGYEREEMLRLPAEVLYVGGKAERDARIAEFAKTGEFTDYEICFRRKDGSLLWAVQNIALVEDERGNRVTEGTVLDVTERHHLEEQLRQSQKMEAIGRLAGGIAHDFNNLLTVIKGYGELLQDRVADDPVLQREVKEIRRAADCAVVLIAQLLAFSRQQVLAPRIIDLNGILKSLDNLLVRLLGEDIDLKMNLASDLGAVKADPHQMEQVIINLAANARDAMPDGGKLILETYNVHSDEQMGLVRNNVQPGLHVALAMTDTGIGMDEETRARIFEPFFTTKELGKGTGLGLATVYGIIKQSGGHILVDSKPGAGATFRIFWPRVNKPVETHVKVTTAKPQGGHERILVVEDDSGVRQLIEKLLKKQGYEVILVDGGENALAVCANHSEPIDLLLCDVVLKEINGRELARRLTELRPKLKVIFMSGYTDDAILKRGVFEADTPFLHKPFSIEALSEKVREVLDAPVVPE